MGFFDSRSRQFRKKIKDLHSELREAEKTGKYIVEEGVFFAELEDMGDATMMFFNAGDLATGAEDEVIRTFFDRNGFVVERLKLDRACTGIQDVEIVPPKEMIMAIGRELKTDGYRMIDDSEAERPADLSQGVFPLSAVVRATVILFAEQVEQIIAHTRIKKNKEGNRLLKWLPKIVDFLSTKVAADAVEAARGPFNDAYARFYGNILEDPKKAAARAKQAAEKMMEMRQTREVRAVPEPTGEQQRPAWAVPGASPSTAPQAAPAAPFHSAPTAPRPVPSIPSAPSQDPPSMPAFLKVGSTASGDPGNEDTPGPADFLEPAPSPKRTGSVDILSDLLGSETPVAPAPRSSAPAAVSAASASSGSDAAALMRRAQTAEALAEMHKSLVRANASRCVRNATVLLEIINKLFDASATCLMVKAHQGSDLRLMAQAGKKLVWGEGGGDGFAISTSVVSRCMRQSNVVTSHSEDVQAGSSMLAHNIEASAAAPIVVEGEVMAVLYIDRRGGFRPFSPDDCRMLQKVAQPFVDFPDLTLGLLG